MKKLLIAFSMIGAGALIACADTAKPVTEDLTWFSMAPGAKTGGTIVAATGAELVENTTDGKFEIDSDIDSRVTFTATDNFTQQMSRVTFTLDAATVPTNALPTLTATDAKVAFALWQKNANTRVFTAWVGAGWIELDGSGALPEEDEPYTLTMEFDNRDASAKKVKFSVAIGDSTTPVALSYNSNEWISYGATAANAGKFIDFVGTGKVARFNGFQLKITSEIVPIEGGETIQVKEEDLKAFENTLQGTSYTKVEDFLAASAKDAFGTGTAFTDGVKVAEAYALGLVKKNGTTEKMEPVDNGEITVKANALANVTGGIPVNMNITPPADSGATVSYQLWGSTDGSDYELIQLSGADSVSSQAEIVIPTDQVTAGKRFFKVKTNVELKQASK